MKKLALAVLLATTTPSAAADLWIDESGDFYLERSDVDLSLFSEMEDEFPRTYCEIPRWPTKSSPETMSCDNGSTHRIEIKDASTLLLNGTPFYKVD